MRALISIGCNAYDQFDKLPLLDGAEADASRVHELLIRDEIGGYDPEISALLLSPRESECRHAISSALGIQGGLDVLTVYFAGHGMVDPGGFYLCLSPRRRRA